MTDDMHALAGEYVLGLCDAAENARIERAMTRDPVLARAIAEWREKLSSLDAVSDRVEPSRDLWERIRAEITRPAQRAVKEDSSGLFSGFAQSLGFWRASALAGAFASLVLALGLGAVLTRSGPQPVVVAILEAADSTPGAIVEAFADGSVTLRPLTDIQVPEGKILQVWTLWDRAVGPVPLGLMQSAQEVKLRRGGQPVPQAQQLYEITLEPAGGSPTGRPTGPILYKGLASRPL
jgi:anti-sigma-K factor RskA